MDMSREASKRLSVCFDALPADIRGGSRERLTLPIEYGYRAHSVADLVQPQPWRTFGACFTRMDLRVGGDEPRKASRRPNDATSGLHQPTRAESGTRLHELKRSGYTPPVSLIPSVRNERRPVAAQDREYQFEPSDSRRLSDHSA